MQISSKSPIGVFDSGLGGLTVVRQLRRRLPRESIVYFGDTGRVPYGTRGPEVIAAYAREAERFLLRFDVKLIVAACGTVSSVAAHTGDELPVPFIGVVNSAAQAASAATRNGCVGVIGTAATIRSGAFTRQIQAARPDTRVVSAECSLLVPLVETGWTDETDPITQMAVQRYLAPIKAEGADCLILGCTHFPVLAPMIAREMGGAVALINTGKTTADAVHDYLSRAGLLGDSDRPEQQYYFSDRGATFSKTVPALIGEPLDEACLHFISADSL